MSRSPRILDTETALHGERVVFVDGPGIPGDHTGKSKNSASLSRWIIHFDWIQGAVGNCIYVTKLYWAECTLPQLSGT